MNMFNTGKKKKTEKLGNEHCMPRQTKNSKKNNQARGYGTGT